MISLHISLSTKNISLLVTPPLLHSIFHYTLKKRCIHWSWSELNLMDNHKSDMCQMNVQTSVWRVEPSIC